MNSSESQMVQSEESTEQKEPKLINGTEQEQVLKYSKEQKHAGCFDFHLHHKPASNHSTVPSTPSAVPKTIAGMLKGLFRSKSESALLAGVDQKGVSNDSSTHGPTAETSQKTKRRFMRIVRDEDAPPPDLSDDNPHQLPRYSQSFLESYWANKKSTDGDPTLPYVITGHTILKKSSGDRLATSLPPTVCLEHSPTLKHATFFSEVEVIEYDLKDKVKTGVHYTHYDHIHDDDDDDDDDVDDHNNDAVDQSSQSSQCSDLFNLHLDSDDTNDRLTDEAVLSNQNAEKSNILSPIGSTDASTDGTHTKPSHEIKHVRLVDRIMAGQEGRRSSVTSNDSLSSVGEVSSGDEGTHDFVATRVRHIDTRSGASSSKQKRKKLQRKQKPQVVEQYSEWTDGILSCM